MEIVYLMAGKRFQARDVADLNSQLLSYKLVSNLDSDGVGDLSVRRLTEAQKTARYDITQSFGDSTDSEGYDVIARKVLFLQHRKGQTKGYRVPVSALSYQDAAVTLR